MIINGLKINYTIIGEGKPFLILHGWGSKGERWQKVAELLAKNGIKVIIPDLPGFGKSDQPQTALEPEEYCKIIEDFIKILNLEKFYLLGHSFGGALAIKCTLDFPNKINKLFLVSAACFRKRSLKKRFFYAISKVFKIFSFLPFYSYIRKGFYKYIVRSDYPYTDGVMKDIYLKIIKKDLSDVLPKIQTPTIIIWGKRDRITPLKDAYLINKMIKNSKLEILSELNHDLNYKDPDKLAETIIKYL